MTTPTPTVKPANGRLGILTVGLGAVSSTLIAGVELAKRGLALPIGSLTQMSTIRLGKRTENRSPYLHWLRLQKTNHLKLQLLPPNP